MILLVIGSAIAAALIVITATVILGRNAVAFSHTAKHFQQLIDPYILRITHMSTAIQNRAMTVSEKTELLQKRVYLLTFTLQKLKVLVDTFQKALDPINRARRYVGI